MQKQQQNTRIAAAKAQGQRVYISGLQCQHSLETGVAYHYRGHFIYAYPAGNPIEPVPFSTKKGINIIGTVQHLAPRYDPNAPDLVPEPSIAALNKSCHHVWEAQKDQEEQNKKEVAQALEAEQAEEEENAKAVEMPTIVRSGSRAVRELPGEAPSLPYSTSLIPSQVLSRGSSRAVSCIGSRDNSNSPLRSLTILDARSNPGDSAPSHSISFFQAPYQSELTSSIAAEEAHDLLNVPGRLSRATTPTLHRSSSHEAHQSFPSRPSSALAAKLHRLSPRPGSSSSLAEFAAHNAHASHGSVSSTTIPGLRHSSSQTGSYGSSPSLTALSHDYTASRAQLAQPVTGMPPNMPSISAYAPQAFWAEHSYTPHDRARFLANSAPGSRLASVTNTPHASRPVSPTLTRSSLHPITSTSRLNQLLTDDTVLRASSPLSDLVEGTTSFSPRMRGFEFRSETNPCTESSSTYTSRGQTPTIVTSPPYSRNKPIGTGRPRRASMALNQAYNAANPVSLSPKEVGSARVPKCALHGEGCDGVEVTETWRTQRAKETVGFKELFPVVEGSGDRVMVDWARLVREEQGLRK